jgi:hypothetical protein
MGFGSSDYMSRSMMGSVAKRGGSVAKKPVVPATTPKRDNAKHGKKVVYVTPHQNSAKEEAAKYEKKGIRNEIKREQDDTGKTVFVVYIYE